MSNFSQHLESHLGPIDRGWSGGGHIQVVRFCNQPHEGVDTLATLGLSDMPLPLDSGREVRQELLVSVYNHFDAEAVASFLLTFAEYVEMHSRALLRGDVVGPSSPLIPQVKADGVYAAMPVFFEDELATYSKTSPSTVIVWLIPIRKEEADYVRTCGWDAFEDLLESVELDFWDLNRAPLDECRSP